MEKKQSVEYGVILARDGMYAIRRAGVAVGSLAFSFDEAMVQLDAMIGRDRGYVRSSTFDVVLNAEDEA